MREKGNLHEFLSGMKRLKLWRDRSSVTLGAYGRKEKVSRKERKKMLVGNPSF
jgi:hypothetical protein